MHFLILFISFAIAASVEYPALNPIWFLRSFLPSSQSSEMYHSMSVSANFRMFEVKEIILLDFTSSYEVLFGLVIIALFASFQVFGIIPVANDCLMISWRLFLMRL